MRVNDTLSRLASSPKATRVLLTVALVGAFALAADPATALECGRPPHDEPFCQY